MKISLKEALTPSYYQKVLLLLQRNDIPVLNWKMELYLKLLKVYPDLKFEDKMYLTLHDEKLSDLHDRLKLMYRIAGVSFE